MQDVRRTDAHTLLDVQDAAADTSALPDTAAVADSADAAVVPDVAIAAKVADASDTSAEGGIVCVRGQVKAVAVGWIGDSWINQLSQIQASNLGALAIADAIWKIMSENCIAQ